MKLLITMKLLIMIMMLFGQRAMGGTRVQNNNCGHNYNDGDESIEIHNFVISSCYTSEMLVDLNKATTTICLNGDAAIKPNGKPLHGPYDIKYIAKGKVSLLQMTVTSGSFVKISCAELAAKLDMKVETGGPCALVNSRKLALKYELPNEMLQNSPYKSILARTGVLVTLDMELSQGGKKIACIRVEVDVKIKD